MTNSPDQSAVKIEEDADKSSQSKSIILAIVLGLLGAVINSIPIELAYNITLIIGNLTFIIAASYLRPALTLLSAAICIAPLFIILGHPFGFITFGLEALFVSYMRGRGWYLPTADLLYWLIIGMPLTAMLMVYTSADAHGYFLFTLFKQSINAIFYTTLAVILIFVFSEKLNRWVKSQQPPLVKNLKQYLHYIMWIMSAFLVVGMCLFLSRNLNVLQQQQFEEKLNISSQYFARVVENYIDDHKKAVSQIANHLSVIEPSDYNETLTQAHKLSPGFISMLIADQNAKIKFSSPSSLMESLPKSAESISDRSYFKQAFFKQSLYISPVFLGRGFGADPIVAISSPIYADNQTNPVGIVEGSINLNIFNQVNLYSANDREIALVLIDENDNVIFSEPNLALTTLSKLNMSYDQSKPGHKLLILKSNELNEKRYLFRQQTLNNGWNVYALIEHREVLQLIERQYLTIFLSLFLVFILVILLADQFANTLNRPLAFALKELAKARGGSGYKPIPFDAPSEFISLYDELQQSKEKLLKQQFILEDKVEKRTRALNEANQALKELASKDSLTGLHNRRFLENKFSELQAILSRNNADMIVAMLDLDNFKQLNDEFGHLVGDTCLEYLGALMKSKFDRRSDIVARFGGEEFIVVAQHDEHNGVLNKLEALREEIAQHVFPHDEHQCFSITISIGAMTAPASYSENIDDWIKLADEQLYLSKNNGRNRLTLENVS